MARAGGGMAARFWALRCCSCRLFQVQQAKRSGKWSCSVCGQRQAVQKIYGQGSGLDCRHHVQKLNLLQGEAEEAMGWTSRCIEESVNDGKNTALQHEDSSVQQEGRPEVSRWSKYLDKDSEDQEDREEEADTERQQFRSWRKNTVEKRRKQPKRFLSSDAQEYAEENGAFQLAYGTKKVKTSEGKKRLVAVADQDDGDAVSGDSTVPAVCESIVENTQTLAACAKSSKWGKFLTLSPQEGSGRLGLHSTAAAGTGVARGCSEQAGRALPQGIGFKFKKHVARTEQLASELSSTSCSVEEDVLFKKPQSQLLRAALETASGRCCWESPRKASTLVNPNTEPKPSTVSCKHLFCTGEEFDDDL